MVAYTLCNVAVFYVFLPPALLNNGFFMSALLLIALALEVISWRGSDNLSIPLGLSLFFLFQHAQAPDFVFVNVVFIVLFIGAYLLYSLKMLTQNGSIAAGLLGFYLLVVAGWNWLIPVLFFFVSSVAFTKINWFGRKRKASSGGRNGWQVLANIFWALLSSILFLITENELFIFLFIASVAAVTADTWASELGPVFNKKSFSVADMKMHEAGITGGISLGGTLAAFAGAFIVSGLSYYLFFHTWNLTIIGILTLSAFLACFADTFLGAFWEEKMYDSEYFTKQKNAESIDPNDLVNLGGSLAAPVFYLLFYFLIV